MTKGMRFNGLVYELGGDALDWHTSDLWRMSLVADNERRAISELGRRYIGDSMCIVFLCADARVRAIRMPAAANKTTGEMVNE